MLLMKLILPLASVTTLVACSLTQQPLLNIMPIGDSITQVTCWRAYLWNQLADNGIKNIQYIGSMTDNKTCNGVSFDRHHEGHAGHQAIDIANKPDQLTTWLKSEIPDIVTVHLGTVDIVFGKVLVDILAAFDKIVDMIRGKNPNVRFIWAQIIPIPSSMAQVAALNAAIPTWIAKKSTANSPIAMVDQNTGFTVATDLRSDGLHPTDAGDKKMTIVWYPEVLEGIKLLQNKTVT